MTNAAVIARPETKIETQTGVMGALSKPVIDIHDLSLTFETADGPVNALSDINLRIDEGDFVSLIGPSLQIR